MQGVSRGRARARPRPSLNSTPSVAEPTRAPALVTRAACTLAGSRAGPGPRQRLYPPDSLMAFRASARAAPATLRLARTRSRSGTNPAFPSPSMTNETCNAAADITTETSRPPPRRVSREIHHHKSEQPYPPRALPRRRASERLRPSRRILLSVARPPAPRTPLEVTPPPRRPRRP